MRKLGHVSATDDSRNRIRSALEGETTLLRFGSWKGKVLRMELSTLRNR